MLYQLVVYAVSQVSNPQSAIIYPTLNPAAKEQRIVVNDPIQGGQIGLVCLKPINLALFSELVSDESRIDDRRKLAKRLAFE
jgi:hypothetical protein